MNKLLTMFCSSANVMSIKPRLFVIGDETSYIYTSSVYRRSGWVQAVKPKLLEERVQIRDITLSGKSTKSFYCEGHWDTIKKLLRKDDCIIIQFGHNDEHPEDTERGTLPATTFKQYLTIFIDDTIAKGAIPVLATPVERNCWNHDQITLQHSHITTDGDYPQVIRDLAAEKKIGIVDVTRLTATLFEMIGKASTGKLFVNNRCSDWIAGLGDCMISTPLTEYGADMIAQLIVDDIVRQKLTPLHLWVKGTMKSVPMQSVIHSAAVISAAAGGGVAAHR